ncbi:hypothetical protein QAD02_022544 [Eretmocerus hayati]|uniref:Uncharacterized protein n=1 Tax=Eretmocerus hayati TaxID=131215 RepID=A0ACC2PTK7_9HYME|nr:hypothetical protein QAD02_022544 [Eretmocerus hayati]
MDQHSLSKTLLIAGFALIVGTFGSQHRRDSRQIYNPPQGFYGDNDLVVVLNADDIEKEIFSNRRDSLVQFYASWCSDSKDFVPVYKSLAKSLKGLSRSLMIGAIDCGDARNLPTCRMYEINEYPSLRYFRSEAPKDSIGENIKIVSDYVVIAKEVVDKLMS